MSFMYEVSADAVAVTGAVDLVEGTTVAADKPVYLHLLEVMQTTDLGDAAEEVLRIACLTGVTAGSGGTAGTEVGLNPDAPAAATATNTFHTTASTGGTRRRLFGWNIRIPTPHVPLPEHRIKVAADEDPYTYRLLAAPVDSITMSVEHVWEEV